MALAGASFSLMRWMTEAFDRGLDRLEALEPHGQEGNDGGPQSMRPSRAAATSRQAEHVRH
jgi:hypothetical protein